MDADTSRDSSGAALPRSSSPKVTDNNSLRDCFPNNPPLLLNDDLTASFKMKIDQRKFFCGRITYRSTVLLLLSLFSCLCAGAGVMTGAIRVQVKKDYFGGDGRAVEMQAYCDGASSFVTLFLLPVVGSLSDTYGRRWFLWMLALMTLMPFVSLVLYPDEILLFMMIQAF